MIEFLQAHTHAVEAVCCIALPLSMWALSKLFDKKEC